MHFILLEEVDSTNSYVALHASELEDMTMVIADSQTAGRGQRGNSWESERGKNLTMTLFCRPAGIHPRDQFAISEAVAIAVADYLEDEGIKASVKWPNDIYAGDRKIAGILIEHSVTSTAIEHTRVGLGLNVNQTEFLSDAPNPVSMAQLTGRAFDVSRVAAALGGRLERRLAQTADPALRTDLHVEFMARMWRFDGKPWPFRRRDTGEVFDGIISDVARHGQILITNDATGQTEAFWFKEVEFLPVTPLRPEASDA